MLKKYKPHIVSVLIALFVGGLSAYLTADNMDIYSYLKMPPLSPPSFLFPVVWSILYILMGISSGIIYADTAASPDDIKHALRSYALQLAMNFIWSLLFFNLKSYLFSFIWLLALLFVIIIMIVRFKKVNSLSAYLQIPYPLWVAFAGYLNLMIYILNP